MFKINRKHYEIIDSTITQAKKELKGLDPDGMTVITALGQTRGQGRWKSHWHSPTGVNIYASYCFKIPKGARFIGNLAQVLAVSAATVLEGLGVRPCLKWPNDLLVMQKKIGGTVCEVVMEGNVMWAINSVGLNVNMEKEEIGRPYTSIFLETGIERDIGDVESELTKRFCEDLEELFQRGFGGVFERFKRYCGDFLGKEIKFRGVGGEWIGILKSVNRDGSMSLKLQDGQEKVFFVGEIV